MVLGEYYYSFQNYSSALNYGLKALPLCTRDEDKANCLNLISLTYFRQSRYEQAVDYAKQCYKIDERSGDPDMMSSSLNSIAGIYIGVNQPQETEQYILKGIELAEKANNSARMAVLQGMASEVYHALGNDEEALKYINESYRIEESLGNGYKMMVRLLQKSSVLIGMHEYEQAEELFNRVIPTFIVHTVPYKRTRLGWTEEYTGMSGRRKFLLNDGTQINLLESEDDRLKRWGQVDNDDAYGAFMDNTTYEVMRSAMQQTMAEAKQAQTEGRIVDAFNLIFKDYMMKSDIERDRFYSTRKNDDIYLDMEDDYKLMYQQYYEKWLEVAQTSNSAPVEMP